MRAPRPGAAAADWAVVAVLSVANLLAGLLEVFLVPLYAGPALVPVSVALALGCNYMAPRLAYGLVPRGGAAFAPILAWLVPVLGLSLIIRPEGDVIIAGGNAEQWVFYALLLLGALAGFVAAVSTAPPRPRTRSGNDTAGRLPAPGSRR